MGKRRKTEKLEEEIRNEEGNEKRNKREKERATKKQITKNEEKWVKGGKTEKGEEEKEKGRDEK